MRGLQHDPFAAGRIETPTLHKDGRVQAAASRVVAFVALRMGCFEQSKGRVALFLEQVLNQYCSPGGVAELQNQAMADSSEGSITPFFALLQQGDEAAAARLWELFVPRLLGLARRTLSSQPRLNGFADDVVQSAFASFFQRARGGQLVIDNRDDLWNLLGVMTVRKARRAIRREGAEKRGGGRVLNEAALPQQPGMPPALDAVPSSQFGPDFDLHAEEMLAELPDELRSVAVLRLMGHTNQEIAWQLDWTVRKVERKLHLIRLRWEKEFPGE